ncbi:hypothetical protein LCGC14_3039020, partial [marine sediment metagenome]
MKRVINVIIMDIMKRGWEAIFAVILLILKIVILKFG